MERNSKFHLTSLHFLLITLLVLGLFFRFINLDRKVYWFDETYTSLRISGYTDREVAQKVFNGQIIGIEDLQNYQGVNSEKNFFDALRSISSSSEHPPLYYSLTRLWVQVFGNSVAVTRSLSAVISLLVFPCLYWLCLELFESPVVAWIAIALMAVSPFHVLYAQEARQYSLWTTVILLSGAALLRGMRIQTTLNWGIYAVTVALGLYTTLLNTLVALGQGIYIAVIERFRLTKVLVDYLLASLAGILAFLPWIWVIIRGQSQMQATTTEMSSRPSLLPFLVKAAGRAGYIFVDINPYSPNPKLSISLVLQYALGLLVVILAAYSLYFLYRNTPQKVWLFIFTLTGSTMLTLLVLDLTLGGSRSSNNRYLIPYFLGIHLSVAYLLGTQISASSVKNWHRKVWQLITAIIISLGVLSCTISSQFVMWWNKGADYNTPYVANIINQSQQPLVVSDDRTRFPFNVVGGVMTLSYRLAPQVKLQLVMEPNIPKIPDGFTDVFLYNPSEALRRGLQKEQNYKIELIYEAKKPAPTTLWKLVEKG